MEFVSYYGFQACFKGNTTGGIFLSTCPHEVPEQLELSYHWPLGVGHPRKVASPLQGHIQWFPLTSINKTNLESPLNLMCISFDSERRPVYPQKTYTSFDRTPLFQDVVDSSLICVHLAHNKLEKPRLDFLWISVLPLVKTSALITDLRKTSPTQQHIPQFQGGKC